MPFSGCKRCGSPAGLELSFDFRRIPTDAGHASLRAGQQKSGTRDTGQLRRLPARQSSAFKQLGRERHAGVALEGFRAGVRHGPPTTRDSRFASSSRTNSTGVDLIFNEAERRWNGRSRGIFIREQTPVGGRSLKHAQPATFGKFPSCPARRENLRSSREHLLSGLAQQIGHGNMKLSRQPLDLLVETVRQLHFGFLHGRKFA